MKIVILGAGPAGLIAAKRCMLEFPDAQIDVLDSQPEFAVNYPIYHPFFFHKDVSMELGIKLQPVDVRVVIHSVPFSEAATQWSLRTIGRLSKNILWRYDKPQNVEKWFVTPKGKGLQFQLYQQLKWQSNIKFRFSVKIEKITSEKWVCISNDEDVSFDILISTIPLSSYSILAGDVIPLSHIAVDVVTAGLEFHDVINGVCEVHYLLDREGAVRLSNTQGFLTMELGCAPEDGKVRYPRQGCMSLPPPYNRVIRDTKDFSSETQKLIRFIPSPLSKPYIFRRTADHDTYFLGRNATWSYKRIEDLVEDMDTIIKLIKAKEKIP